MTDVPPQHATAPPGPDSAGALGMWFNKRSLSHLEVPVRHRLEACDDGWRMHFTEAGKITAHTTDGPLTMSVEPCDHLVSSGEEFFLTLARPVAAQGG